MDALGIDLKLMIAQAINFGILLFVLSKLLYKPITTMLNERSTKITKSMKDIEIAAKNLEKSEIDADHIREQAYKDANEILANAKAEAGNEATAIVKKSMEQADRVLASAKDEAARVKKSALLEARSEIASVVSLALDKIVDDQLSKDEKSKLTAQAIKEL